MLDKDLFKDENLKKMTKLFQNLKYFLMMKTDLPSKEEMDKNLDNLKIERDKNLNFFQRLFKKDRMSDAERL